MIMQSIAAVVLVLSAAAADAAHVATVRDHNRLGPGYTETYQFTMDGKGIGAQTASLTDMTPNGVQTWSFETHLQIPASGTTVPIHETGTFVISDTGYPRWIKLHAETPSGVHDVSLDVTGGSPHLTALVNGSTLRGDVPYKHGQFLSLNNNITLLSLALSSIPRPAGQTLTLPLLSVDGLLPATFTLKPTGTDDIGSTHCTIYDVAPIGEQFWVDNATGAIVKVTDARQNLEIVRQLSARN